MKPLALVASVYNETDQIKQQLKSSNITSVDVFPYQSEPEGYISIEYNVRPDKTHGEILDLAQCISIHGFPDDKYVPPTKTVFSDQNNMNMDKATKHLVLASLGEVLPDGLTEINREGYNKVVEKIKQDKSKLTSLTEDQIYAKMEFESDPMVIIAMFTVLFDKQPYCIDMVDNWGNPTRGYRAKSDKDVKGFMNARSIGWISELWSDLLPKQTEYNQKKYLKALRTRGKNAIKDRSSIYGLRFFIDFLIEKDTETTIPEPEDNTTVVYEGFDLEESDIPFSILLIAPILSYGSYLNLLT